MDRDFIIDIIRDMVGLCVDTPDDVVVELLSSSPDIYYITVNPEEIGQAIGKAGINIAAIRHLIKIHYVSMSQPLPQIDVESDPLDIKRGLG